MLSITDIEEQRISSRILIFHVFSHDDKLHQLAVCKMFKNKQIT